MRLKKSWREIWTTSRRDENFTKKVFSPWASWPQLHNYILLWKFSTAEWFSWSLRSVISHWSVLGDRKNLTALEKKDKQPRQRTSSGHISQLRNWSHLNSILTFWQPTQPILTQPFLSFKDCKNSTSSINVCYMPQVASPITSCRAPVSHVKANPQFQAVQPLGVQQHKNGPQLVHDFP